MFVFIPRKDVSVWMRREKRTDLVENKFTDLFPTFLYMYLSKRNKQEKCDILDAFVLKPNGAGWEIIRNNEKHLKLLKRSAVTLLHNQVRLEIIKNISATLSKSQHFHTRKHSKNLWKLEEKVEQLIIHVYFKHLTEVKIGTTNILPKKKSLIFKTNWNVVEVAHKKTGFRTWMIWITVIWMSLVLQSQWSSYRKRKRGHRAMLYLVTRW